MAKLNIWETPDSYAGFNPVGHILVAAKHRDSDCLTRSNWIISCQRIAKVAGVEALPDLADLYEGGWPSGRRLNPEEMPAAYTFSASHCLVGWVEYMLVRNDAPEVVIAEAQAIADEISNYPALNEDHWSEMEWEEAQEYWAGMSLRDRLDIITDSRGERACSIFAIRRDYIPQDDNGFIFERLTRP
jgi:hypothetical protein